MADKAGESNGVPEVGSHVRVTVRGSDTSESVTCAGVVVEDYANLMIDSVAAGRDWAQVHRWGVALDDGRLVFVNDEDLVTGE